MVRYLLADGSATDALGLCTAWGDTSCVIETSRGPVSVPLEAIVTGKPVPPRASVRQRVSVRDAELHTTALRQAGSEVEELGDWQLRFEPVLGERLRRRLNSCLAVGEPGVPGVPEALERVRAFYEARGREPLLHVEAGTTYPGWEAVPDRDSFFQLTSIAQALRGASRSAPDRVAPQLEADGSHATATLPAAHAEADLQGDWLCVENLWVDPEQRRRGHARALITALLEWGAEQGAGTAWLHVETRNRPAQALYESLGFRTHHTMGYLRPAPWGR